MRGDWEAGNLHANALTLRIDEQIVSLTKRELINRGTHCTCVKMKVEKQQGVKKLLSDDNFTPLYEDLISETN